MAFPVTHLPLVSGSKAAPVPIVDAQRSGITLLAATWKRTMAATVGRYAVILLWDRLLVSGYWLLIARFPRCASLWADLIIIADQTSIDGSRQIRREHSKVALLDNPGKSYSEGKWQKKSLAEARIIPDPRFIRTLDEQGLRRAV